MIWTSLTSSSPRNVISSSDSHRQATLATSLAAIRREIADTCAAVGRSPQSVVMIAVTKGFPVEDVLTLVRLGLSDFGESRDQHARPKASLLAELADPAEAGGEVRWHFVGQLQTNKARSVAQYAHAVHSLDRVELARALDTALERLERDLEVFIQVSLDGAPDRGGVSIEGVSALADQIAALGRLRLAGVMAVAPLGADPGQAFSTLAEVSQRLQSAHPSASAISAGMSADFAVALQHGATHLRIGSALLGRRSDNLR
jgi:pyridoxal phosphate enzyme (YggS family)